MFSFLQAISNKNTSNLFLVFDNIFDGPDLGRLPLLSRNSWRVQKTDCRPSGRTKYFMVYGSATAIWKRQERYYRTLWHTIFLRNTSSNSKCRFVEDLHSFWVIFLILIAKTLIFPSMQIAKTIVTYALVLIQMRMNDTKAEIVCHR